MPITIKEASDRLGIPPHTIRYYEKEGLLPDVKRDASGNRLFEQKDLDWMKLMTCFRKTGMPIADLRHIVDLAQQGESTVSERKAILERHKAELSRRQSELDDAFEVVNRKLAVYEAIQRGDSVLDDNFRIREEMGALIQQPDHLA